MIDPLSIRLCGEMLSFTDRVDDVLRFLTELEIFERPLALAEVEKLARAKQTLLKLPDPPQLNAWDREFYMHKLLLSEPGPPSGPSGKSSEPLFAAGAVFQALSRLFTHIYGMRLEPRETEPGEVWHSEVRRLDVIDESEGLVGE